MNHCFLFSQAVTKLSVIEIAKWLKSRRFETQIQIIWSCASNLTKKLSWLKAQSSVTQLCKRECDSVKQDLFIALVDVSKKYKPLVLER